MEEELFIKIPGLADFEKVKNAQNRLEALLEEVAAQKAIIDKYEESTKFLKLEDPNKFQELCSKADEALALNKKRFQRSLYILDSIETRIGRDGELYRNGIGYKGIDSYSNSLMAILFALQDGAKLCGLPE